MARLVLKNTFLSFETEEGEALEAACAGVAARCTPTFQKNPSKASSPRSRSVDLPRSTGLFGSEEQLDRLNRLLSPHDDDEDYRSSDDAGLAGSGEGTSSSGAASREMSVMGDQGMVGRESAARGGWCNRGAAMMAANSTAAPSVEFEMDIVEYDDLATRPHAAVPSLALPPKVINQELEAARLPAASLQQHVPVQQVPLQAWTGMAPQPPQPPQSPQQALPGVWMPLQLPQMPQADASRVPFPQHIMSPPPSPTGQHQQLAAQHVMQGMPAYHPEPERMEAQNFRRPPGALAAASYPSTMQRDAWQKAGPPMGGDRRGPAAAERERVDGDASPSSPGKGGGGGRRERPVASPATGSHKNRDYRHAHVPKTVDLAEVGRQHREEDAAPTTLMIRNIPNHFTQKQLIGVLESVGLAGTFDFLYIPLDKGTMSNVGYAFVNFVAPEWAVKCMEVFQDFRFKRHRKVAAISIAHLQGLEANLAHYENAAVSCAKLKQRRPVVMAAFASSFDAAQA